MTPESASPSLTVLTRDEPGNRLWKAALKRRNITVYELPCIETVATPLSSGSQKLLNRLSAYEWLIFTSAAGVRFFAELVATSTIDRHTLAQRKIAAVGRTTADSITARGLVVSFTPSQANVNALASQLPGIKNHDVLFVQAAVTEPNARNVLERRGAHVDVLPVYQTNLLTDRDPVFSKLLDEGGVGRVVFASPSAVSAYWTRLNSNEHKIATKVAAIAIGQATASSLASRGFTTVAVAKTPNVEAVINLI